MKNKRLSTIFIISIISIILNIVLSLGKAIIGINLLSGAIVSDAVHSASDVLSTIIIIIGTFIANKKEDKNHPYGHERFEEIASILLGSLLFFTGFEILKEAIITLKNGNYNLNVENLSIGILLCIISIVSKFLMFLFTYIYAKKIDSSALKADGYHHLSDSLSSIGALLGLIGVMNKYYFADSIAALIISLFIFKTAIDIIKESTNKLTDMACDECDEKKIKEEILKFNNVTIDSIKTRKFSNKIYVDVEIALDKSLSLYEAHEKAENIHDKLEKVFPEIKHCMIHINPK